MGRKSVKTITIAGITGGIVGSTVIDGRNTTNGEIGAYGDTLFTTSCSPVLHASDLTVDVLDEGGQYEAIKAMVSTTQSVTITTAYGDGDGAPTSVTSLTGKCAILSAVGDPVAVDSDGKSVIHVTIRKQPDPPSATAQTQG